MTIPALPVALTLIAATAGPQSGAGEIQIPTCVDVVSAPERYVGKPVAWIVRLRDIEGEAPKQRTVFECRDAAGAWKGVVIGPSLADLTRAPSPTPPTVVRGEVRRMRGTVVDVERRTLPDGTVANVAVVGDAVLTMAEDGQVFTPGSTHGVSWPTVIHEEKPRYTQEGLRAKIQGTVEMEIVVLEDGTVGDVGVTKSLDTKYGLDQAAIAAAKNWRFKPGIRNGVPVPTRVGLILEFRLSK